MRYSLTTLYVYCLLLELHDSIKNQHQDVYIERQQAEMTSGIFNVPLPPNLTGLNLVCWTLVESFNKWHEENRSYINYIRITISILALCTILINPNWHETGRIYLPYNFRIGFCQLNFYQKFPNIFGGEN